MYKVLVLVLALSTATFAKEDVLTNDEPVLEELDVLEVYVRPEECRRPHEHRACRQHQETCDNQGQTPVPDKPCKEGCYCVKGYVRDHQGHCIPRSECPETQQRQPKDLGVPPNPSKPRPTKKTKSFNGAKHEAPNLRDE